MKASVFVSSYLATVIPKHIIYDVNISTKETTVPTLYVKSNICIFSYTLPMMSICTVPHEYKYITLSLSWINY